jgi:spermidine/putrescine transport system permease protein
MTANLSFNANIDKPLQRIAKDQAALLLPAIALIFLFVILPLCLIIIFSFLKPGTYGGVEWAFSAS